MTEKRKLNLQLFAEEGAVSAPAGETTGVTEEKSSPVSRSARSSAAERRKAVLSARSEPQKKPEQQTGAEPAEEKESNTTRSTQPRVKEDLAAEFESLISGRYKDVFGDRVKNIISERFKKNDSVMAQTRSELEKYREIADRIAGRYDVESTDAEALIKALDEDDALFEEAADAAGMSTEQFKAFRSMKMKSKRDDETIKALNREREDRETYQRRRLEEKALQQQIPEYSFLRESQNPAFRRLINAGIPQKDAYNLVHAEEIRTKEITEAVSAAEQKFKAALDNSQSRPSIMGSTAPAQSPVQYSNMTPKQRLEAVKKARYGG